LTWKIWDGTYYRLYTFYVGENGIQKNTKYYFDNNTKKIKKGGEN
jgi:hypothetical protein